MPIDARKVVLAPEGGAPTVRPGSRSTACGSASRRCRPWRPARLATSFHAAHTQSPEHRDVSAISTGGDFHRQPSSITTLSRSFSLSAPRHRSTPDAPVPDSNRPPAPFPDLPQRVPRPHEPPPARRVRKAGPDRSRPLLAGITALPALDRASANLRSFATRACTPPCTVDEATGAAVMSRLARKVAR